MLSTKTWKHEWTFAAPLPSTALRIRFFDLSVSLAVTSMIDRQAKKKGDMQLRKTFETAVIAAAKVVDQR